MSRMLPAGIGLRLTPETLQGFGGTFGPPAFVEILADDFMGDGGPAHRLLRRLRTRLPLSIHSGGLAIGSTGSLDRAYLCRLAALCDRHAPVAVSEQFAWASHAMADLRAARLQPLTESTLARAVDHVHSAQLRLGRRLMMETLGGRAPRARARGNRVCPGRNHHAERDRRTS